MTDTNKVEYGLSEIHVGTYTVGLNGEVTMGPPYRMPGAVALNLDPETEEIICQQINRFLTGLLRNWCFLFRNTKVNQRFKIL